MILPVSLRIIAITAIVAVASGASWYVNGLRWESKYKALELAQTEARLKGWETAAKVHKETVEGFRNDLQTIANRKPARPVLVCSPGVPRTPGGTAGAGADGLQDAARTDIGPSLAALADKADRCAAQLNALIKSYDRSGKN